MLALPTEVATLKSVLRRMLDRWTDGATADSMPDLVELARVLSAPSDPARAPVDLSEAQSDVFSQAPLWREWQTQWGERRLVSFQSVLGLSAFVGQTFFFKDELYEVSLIRREGPLASAEAVLVEHGVPLHQAGRIQN